MAVTVGEARRAAVAWLSAVTATRAGGPVEGAAIPLYRMRLTRAERRDLGILLQRVLSSPMVAHLPPRPVCALFCLFAAETLRGCDEPGQWSWTPIADALGLRRPLEHAERANLVTHGLAYWGLPLRRGTDGDRLLLHTLLFQAGLPDQLIGRPEFQNFLRAALGAIERFEAGDPDVARPLVADEARHLPPPWRNEETLDLAAELLLALRPVREALRRHGPAVLGDDWRAGLPLDLSNAGAERLLQALIAEPRTEAAPSVLKALCRRMLVACGEGAWEQRLAPAPRGLAPAAFVAGPPFAGRDPPVRVRLSVAGTELAMLESEQDGGTLWRYRPRAVTLPVALERPAIASLLVDGDECARMILPGGDAAGTGIWVFEEESSGGALELVGEGTRTSRASCLFVALDPATGGFEPISGDVAAVGSIAGTSRRLYSVAGDVLWRGRDEPFPVRLRTGADHTDAARLLIDARSPRWTVTGAAPCLGSPAVGTADRRAQVLFRARGSGDPWCPLPPTISPGLVDIVLVRDGMLIERRTLAILPVEAEIIARQTPTGFDAEVAGFDPALVALPDFPEALRRMDDGGRVRFTVSSRRLPPSGLVVVTRLGGCDVSHHIRMRFNRGMLLDGDGAAVAAHRMFSFRDLAGLVAHAADPGQPAEIGVGLTAGADAPPALAGIRFARSLRFTEEFPLARLMPELRRLHATAGGRDARLRLAVRVNGADGSPIAVGPYGATLEIERGRDLMRLTGGEVTAPGLNGGLAAVAIARPAAAPVDLAPVEAGGWWLPRGEGPWLLAGTGALAMQVRPTLFPGAPGGDRGADGRLAAAARCADSGTRGDLFAAAFAALAGAPDEACHGGEWAFLDATLDAAAALVAPLFFDALVQCIRSPQVLAHWLLRTDDTRLAALLALEDGLPFSWTLVPVAAWRCAARGFLARYADLPTIGPQALAGRLDAIAEASPSLRAGIWEAREATGLPHPGNEFSSRAIPRDLLRTLVAPDPGPAPWHDAVAQCSRWENFPALVMAGAPHMAARYALGLAEPDLRSVSAIRFCRQLAVDRFDRDFRLAHLLHRDDRRG